MQEFFQNVRYGLRMLAKGPGFTVVVIATLALGIGANTALFSAVKTVLLSSLPYRDADRLVTLTASESTSIDPQNVSFLKTQDWRERSKSFQSIALYRAWRASLSGQGKPEMLRAGRVSQEFFPTLGITPVLGRNFLKEEDQPDRCHVALLTYAYWNEEFGGRADAVGKMIRLNDIAFEIVGVLPENFEPLAFSYFVKPPQIWVPLGYAASDGNSCRTCQHLRAVARLQDGVTIAGARAEMNAISARLRKEFPNDYAKDEIVLIQPLRDRVVGKVRTMLWLLLGATGFVLLIGCANIANLMLSRATVRQRELAVRAALGATRWTLARQLLTEMALLSLAGGVCGAMLAEWGVRALVNWGPASIPRLADLRVDGVVLAFTLGVSALTAILAGVMPAVQGSKVDEREALQRSGRGTIGSTRGRLRSVLVGAEVGLAVVLVMGTGLLLRSLQNVIQVKPGFETHNLQSLNYALVGTKYKEDPPTIEFEQEAMQKIRGIAGVEDAAYVSTLPLGGGYDQRNFYVKGRAYSSETEAPSVDSYYVSDNYLETMKIPLIRGRGFTAADMRAGKDGQVALISETTAWRYFSGEDPIGKGIQLGGHSDKKPWATIVGIVGDVRQYGLDIGVTPDAYVAYTQNVDNFPTVVVRSGLATETLRRLVEEQIATLQKDVPVFDAASMDGMIEGSLAERRFVSGLVGGFGVLALVLAAIGIYGVVAYGVAQRTSEFGIRLALGAQSQDVLRLVLAGGMSVVLCGMGAGVILAFVVMRVMKSLLYQVNPGDPVTLAVVCIILPLVAICACALPAWRATRVDPIAALHYE